MKFEVVVLSNVREDQTMDDMLGKLTAHDVVQEIRGNVGVKRIEVGPVVVVPLGKDAVEVATLVAAFC